jgi:hypothetical protein
VLFGLGDEAALDHQLGQLEVNRRPSWSVPENLVAERNGVVVEAPLHVAIHPPLPHLHRLLDAAELLVEIPHLVEQGQLLVQLGRTLELLEDFEIRLDGLLGLILDLEGACFLLELGDTQG